MPRERPNETMKVDENPIFNGDPLMFDLDAENTTAINNILRNAFTRAALNVYNTIGKTSMNERIFRKFVSRLTKTKIPKIFGFPLVPQFLKRDLVGSNTVKMLMVLLKVTFDKDF
uniref:Reverse transcriptase domain-containing protein n=1 Tax=Strongyloides venezuelensis TaxID=75913 RepID=A0A0K0FAX6_STRVS